MQLLHAPMFIGSRLMAAVKVADGGTIHIEPSRTEGLHTVWHYVIETAEHGTHEDSDLRSPIEDSDIHKAMSSLLSFLGAAAEAYRHEMRTSRETENSDMFPDAINEWAYLYDTELFELQEALADPEGLRTCDRCGRTTDAEDYPDWPNGVCEECDPSILPTRRLDVVFEGAIESQEDYTEADVWPAWNEKLTELERDHMDDDWELSIYDTRPYPPEVITTHRNDPTEDDDE